MADDIIDIEDLNIEPGKEHEEEDEQVTEVNVGGQEEHGHIRSIQHLSGMYEM